MRRLTLALLLLTACHRNVVPVGVWLLRLDGEWTTPENRPDLRLAPATVIVFRPDHEYVELHAWVVERPDDTLYIEHHSPRVSIVGRWEKKWSRILATRQGVAVSSKYKGSIAPFCAPLTFQLAGKTVSGDLSGKGVGVYEPVTRLVAPDFEYYVKDARNSPSRCAPPSS